MPEPSAVLCRRRISSKSHNNGSRPALTRSPPHSTTDAVAAAAAARKPPQQPTLQATPPHSLLGPSAADATAAVTASTDRSMRRDGKPRSITISLGPITNTERCTVSGSQYRMSFCNCGQVIHRPHPSQGFDTSSALRYAPDVQTPRIIICHPVQEIHDPRPNAAHDTSIDRSNARKVVQYICPPPQRPLPL